jgi:membrane protein implicated in regulation of membrane protease activity
MAQLITILVLVFSAWWLNRRFVSDARKLTEKSRRAEKERQTGAIGTLVKDPVTGEYRLKRDEE